MNKFIHAHNNKYYYYHAVCVDKMLFENHKHYTMVYIANENV
jgi:hypothetical protein